MRSSRAPSAPGLLSAWSMKATDIREAIAREPVLGQGRGQLQCRQGGVLLERPRERGVEVLELLGRAGAGARRARARRSPCRFRVAGRARGTSGSGARGPTPGRRAPRTRSAAYARIVSSIPSLVGASACRRRTSRLLATRRSSVSRSAPVIVSAASIVAPPANTAKRAKHAFSSSLSSGVAPVDRRAQRLLARGRVAGAGARARRGRRPGARRSRAGDSSAAAGGGQLDRQRQPVDAPADLRDRRGVAVARAQSRDRGLARARTNSVTASSPAKSPGPRRSGSGSASGGTG